MSSSSTTPRLFANHPYLACALVCDRKQYNSWRRVTKETPALVDLLRMRANGPSYSLRPYAASTPYTVNHKQAHFAGMTIVILLFVCLLSVCICVCVGLGPLGINLDTERLYFYKPKVGSAAGGIDWVLDPSPAIDEQDARFKHFKLKKVLAYRPGLSLQ